MKKQLITLCVAAVLLVALIISLVFINKANKKAEEAENESTAIDVFSLETDDVYGFSFTDSGDDPVSFHYDGENWIYDAYEDATLNEDAINSILTSLCNITATEILSGEKASDFGFDEPSYIFTVTDSLGNVTKISYGIQNSITNEYYFILNDDTSMIYVNDGSVITTVENNVENIISTEASSEDEDAEN